MRQRNIRRRRALEKLKSVLRTELPRNTTEERIKTTPINTREKIACMRYYEI